MPFDMDAKDYVERPTEVRDNQARDLVTGDGNDFPHLWMRWILFTELFKYRTDREIVGAREALVRAHRILNELSKSGDWIPAELNEFLEALREVALADESLPLCSRRNILVGSKHLPVLEWRPGSGEPFAISDRATKRVLIAERMLSSPEYAEPFIDAISDLLLDLRGSLQATHVVFIEKQMGFVGMLAMFGSIVAKTKLDGVIYRPDRWSDMGSFATDPPPRGARVIILYDILASGHTLTAAADFMSAHCGAETVAAVVLSGIGKKRTSLTTNGHNIPLRVVAWFAEAHGTDVEELAQRLSEMPNRSASRQKRREDRAMVSKTNGPSIRPGTYNLKGLPAMSPEVEALRAEIIREAGLRVASTTTGTTRAPKRLGVTLSKERGVGLQIRTLVGKEKRRNPSSSAGKE